MAGCCKLIRQKSACGQRSEDCRRSVLRDRIWEQWSKYGGVHRSTAPPPLIFPQSGALPPVFSRGEFQFEKLRNRAPWLHERGRGARAWVRYVTHKHKTVMTKRSRQNICLLHVTRCQIVWALPSLESYFDHCLRVLAVSSWTEIRRQDKTIREFNKHACSQ